MNIDLIKSRARTLVNFLKSRQYDVNYQTALDAVAVMECGRDFNTASAVAKKKPGEKAEKTTRHNGCNCKICQNTRSFNAKIAELPEDKRGFFEVMYDELLETQMDNDYMSVILDGSWPGSVSILEKALARAKERQAPVTPE